MSRNANPINDFFRNHLQSYFAIHNGDVPNSGLHRLILSEVEKVMISETLKYTGGIQAKAALILGISRNTLKKKMNELGLS